MAQKIMNGKRSDTRYVPTAMADKMKQLSERQTDHVFIKRLDTRMQIAETPSMPIHAPLCSFVYLTSGTILVSHSNRTVMLRQCECMIIPAGDDFAVRYYDKCTGYMGAFRNDMLPEGIAVSHTDNKFVLSNRQSIFVGALMERIIEENGTAAPDRQIVKYCLALFMSEIFKPATGANDEKVGDSRNRLCDKFMNIVFKSFRDNLTIDDYAARLNISPTHLYKTIKHHTGRTPLEWIHEAMISEAKIQLGHSDASIAEIASSLGFFDASYFTRLFGKLTGTTPSEYRRSTEKS